jgi:hypothetical protein
MQLSSDDVDCERARYPLGRWLQSLKAAASRHRTRSVADRDAIAVYSGGCHCRRVRFEVRAPARLTLLDCNCSICRMTAYLHLVVPASDFTLVSGEGYLTTYQFLTKTAEHRFCSVCGIKAFYVPRADAFSRSVNARCLDAGPGPDAVIIPFDGKGWKQPGGRI